MKGDEQADFYQVLLVCSQKQIDPLQAVCALVGEHGFTAAFKAIPYWLGWCFGGVGESKPESGHVGLVFKRHGSDEYRFHADDVHPAMTWAGRVAVAWINGDMDNLRALMEQEISALDALAYSDAMLAGLVDNFNGEDVPPC